MPSTRTEAILKPKLLVGEGIDEKNFIEALVNYVGRQDLQVEHYRGKDFLKVFLQALNSRTGYQQLSVIGITRDTDKGLQQDFDSVCDALKKSGFQPPSAPGQFGTGSPRIGVFLMPDNTRQGMLEDLCLDAVKTDAATTCVDDYFKCVAQKANRQPSEPSKARVHAWLASQVKPDLRLGEAAKASIWPFDNPAFDPLKHFLHSL